MGKSNIKNSHLMYVDQLTWLRGFAALFVIVSHSNRATDVKYLSEDQISDLYLYSLFDMGSFGVVLFFVLSGCTLYISNANKVSNYAEIKQFYVKRFFRIWPAFVVSLVFYMLFSLVFAYFYIEPQGHWIEKQFLTEYSVKDVLAYVTLTFNVTGPSGLFNNAYWSLPVEFQYYLIFPLIILALNRTGVIGPVLIGMILFVFSKVNVFGFDKDSVFALAYSFCGGVLIGYFYLNLKFRLNQWLSYFLLLLIVFIVSAISHGDIALPDIPLLSDKRNWFVFFGLAATFIVLFSCFNINKKVESILKYYGTISYSTYLYHNLLIAVAVLGLIHLEIHDSHARFLIVFFFAFISSYLVAAVSYKYIELPSIKIGRSILKKTVIDSDSFRSAR